MLRIILFIIILFAIFLTACQKEIVKENVFVEQIPKEPISDQVPDIDLLNLAIDSNDFEFCGKIKNIQQKGYCNDLLFNKRAISVKNPELCSQILNDKVRQNCNNFAK